LYVSGQVGVTPEGRVLDGAEAQIEQAWRNVLSVLEAAGMGPRDLVKVTTFLLDRADLAAARAIRERMLQGAEPASTLLIVAGLASPEWRVEIEAVAAAA
jgi:2-iminobutanoate/2-iminopropanoate deaminase